MQSIWSMHTCKLDHDPLHTLRITIWCEARLVDDHALFAHADASLARAFVGAGLQADLRVTPLPVLLFREVTFVRFRHLWAERWSVESFVLALNEDVHRGNECRLVI